MIDDPASKISRLTIGGIIPALLAATLGATIPLPAAGQSDQACIAYMEADAVFKSVKEAYRDAIFESVVASAIADAVKEMRREGKLRQEIVGKRSTRGGSRESSTGSLL